MDHNTRTPGSAGGSPAGWYSRGYLPHYDSRAGYQMITYRLADALPQDVIKKYKGNNQAQTRIDIEKHLDKNYGSCILAHPDIASMIIENWQRFHRKQYNLIAYVVMPNHVHLLIQVFETMPLSRIVHGWKSYTAKKIKSHLINAGGSPALKTKKRLRLAKHARLAAGEPPALPGIHYKIWQEDYWDRYIRDEIHFYFAIEYIHQNPVKAGLCSQPTLWHWSSASREN